MYMVYTVIYKKIKFTSAVTFGKCKFVLIIHCSCCLSSYIFGVITKYISKIYKTRTIKIRYQVFIHSIVLVNIHHKIIYISLFISKDKINNLIKLN